MYISKGNRKLGGNQFLIYNLPARKTCPGCTKKCTAKCYAVKAERIYRGVLACREQNLTDSLQENFVERMVAEIAKLMAKHQYKYFRWHESGDAYSQKYLDDIFEISSKFSEIKFLMFTKSFHLDFSQKPDNVQVIWSVWEDSDVDKLPKEGIFAYAGDCTNVAGERYASAFECGGKCTDCQHCWNSSQDVRFHIH